MSNLKPYQLTVLTTSQCTARCGHCSVNSGPERRDRLDADNIRHAISRLHDVQPLRVVIFAGGEPTLLGEQLLDAIAQADGLGIVTRVVTNAYWATSSRAAREKLVALREAGLAEVNFSADDYHLPYIPFKRIVNAWKASKGLGFEAVVIANCYGPRSRVTPAFIKEHLGEDLPEVYDSVGFRRGDLATAPDGTRYGISNAFVQNLGRSHVEVPQEDIPRPSSESMFAGPCPWAIQSAALSPKNHLVACCGMEAEGNAVLDFGSASERDFETLLESANDDLVVNAIAYLGPLFLKKFIQTYDSRVNFRPQYASMCELCEDIVTRRETLAALTQFAPELATVVISAQQRASSEGRLDESNGHDAGRR